MKVIGLMSEKNVIAVIGLGYVGLPLAVEFAKYRKVIGFDINNGRVESLKMGFDSNREVSKHDLDSVSHNIKFTENADDIGIAKIYIITVPTPIDDVNRPDLLPLIFASQLVGKHLKKDDLVVYESTVYPGATEEVCVPELLRESGLIYNKDFFCGYSPERINPGDKDRTISTIKKITSGSNYKAAVMVDSLYAEIIKAGTVRVSSIKVAEAAKVIENTQRDLNIAFVNELAMIFNIIDIDTSEVLEAAKSKWNFMPFNPGMVGGHCISIDPYYLTHKAEQLGYRPSVIHAARTVNNSMAHFAAINIIKKLIKNNADLSKASVGILGVSFKENCPDIRNSKVFDLISELQAWNISVVVDDYQVDPDVVYKEQGIKLEKFTAEHKLSAVVIAVAHEQYKNLSLHDLAKLCSHAHKPILADLKSIFSRDEVVKAGFDVFRF